VHGLLLARAKNLLSHYVSSSLRIPCMHACQKKNRPKQELVSVLKSYSVPIREFPEMVVYDTGLEKRGLTVFLGEKGKIIHGD